MTFPSYRRPNLMEDLMFAKLWHHTGFRKRQPAPVVRRGRRPHRLRVEQLEDRCWMSDTVVVHWNQLVLDTAKAIKVNPVFMTRDLAIESAAVYDAANDIDRSHTVYFADVKASRGASLDAAAAQAAHD